LRSIGKSSSKRPKWRFLHGTPQTKLQTILDMTLELQARCGLRIGESLKIRVSDVSERKILLREPKSGKEAEMAYMPEPVAKRMAEYIREANLESEDRLFPVCYSTARAMIRNLGARLKMKITPHDLRQYSATYASHNGVPLEIVSKVILRRYCQMLCMG
jgi:integrase/recombinase XerD